MGGQPVGLALALPRHGLLLLQQSPQKERVCGLASTSSVVRCLFVPPLAAGRRCKRDMAAPLTSSRRRQWWAEIVQHHNRWWPGAVLVIDALAPLWRLCRRNGRFRHIAITTCVVVRRASVVVAVFVAKFIRTSPDPPPAEAALLCVTRPTGAGLAAAGCCCSSCSSTAGGHRFFCFPRLLLPQLF